MAEASATSTCAVQGAVAAHGRGRREAAPDKGEPVCEGHPPAREVHAAGGVRVGAAALSLDWLRCAVRGEAPLLLAACPRIACARNAGIGQLTLQRSLYCLADAAQNAPGEAMPHILLYGLPRL